LRRKAAFVWSFWAAIAGLTTAFVLVLVFRVSQSAAIYHVFTSIDRLGFVAASTATSLAFPGERVERIVSIAAFFDVILVVVTGLQCGVLGFFAGLLADRRAGGPHLRSRRRS